MNWHSSRPPYKPGDYLFAVFSKQCYRVFFHHWPLPQAYRHCGYCQNLYPLSVDIPCRTSIHSALPAVTLMINFLSWVVTMAAGCTTKELPALCSLILHKQMCRLLNRRFCCRMYTPIVPFLWRGLCCRFCVSIRRKMFFRDKHPF